MSSPEQLDLKLETSEGYKSGGFTSNRESQVSKLSNINKNPEFLDGFIALYKSFPCLWQFSSPIYHNKWAKDDAYQILTDFYKKFVPSANRNTVVRKIASLRSNVRKEFRNIREHERKHVFLKSEDVYKPTLPYFEQLKFIGNQREEESDSEDEDTNLIFNRDFVKGFISLYKNLPCLWREPCPKVVKNEALCQLLEFYKKFDANADIRTVRRKITSFRCSYRREVNKIKISEQESKSPGDIYKPSLWYYKLLKFLSFEDERNMKSGAFYKPNLNCDPSFISGFIKMYKTLPCLWKVSCRGYRNRNAQKDAYEKLVEYYKKFDKNANTGSVIRKIVSLRSSFRKELRKVKEREETCANGEKVYKPCLWYFSQLMFLADPNEETTSDQEDIDKKLFLESETEIYGRTKVVPTEILKDGAENYQTTSRYEVEHIVVKMENPNCENQEDSFENPEDILAGCSINNQNDLTHEIYSQDGRKSRSSSETDDPSEKRLRLDIDLKVEIDDGDVKYEY